MTDSDPYLIPNASVDQLLKPDQNRIGADSIFGQSISAGKIGDIITGNPASTNLGTGLSSGAATIADASSLSYIFTLTDNYNRVLVAIPDIAIYVDGSAVANQWPNTTYGMGNMPITWFNDWGLTNNVNTVTRVVVRNNTGGSRSVTVIVRWRLITNSTAALNGPGLGDSSQ